MRQESAALKKTDNYTILCGNENENLLLGTRFFIQNGIISAVKTAESVSNRVLYTVLRGCWCDDMVGNVHSTVKNKNKILKQVFNQYPIHHINILLVNFS